MLIIISGTKRKVQKLGYAADFCPICRDVRACQVDKISMVSHVYYISFGAGETVGYVYRCLECGFEAVTEPPPHTGISSDRGRDIMDLVARTHPEIAARYAERLDAEDQLRTNPEALDEDLRSRLILEPLEAAAPAVETRYTGNTQFDKETGLGCLATLTIPMALLFVLSVLARPDSRIAPALGIVVGLLFGIGCIVTLFYLLTTNGRWVRRTIVPMLAASLAPLAPTVHELNEAITQLKANGLRVGKKLKAERIADAIRKTQPKPGERVYDRLPRGHAEEGRVAASPGPEKTMRREQVQAAFDELAPQIENRFSQSLTLDRHSGLGCLGTILVTVVLYALAVIAGGRGIYKPYMTVIIFAVLVIGVIFTLGQCLMAGRRYIRKRVLPYLGRQLAPLNPTEHEIDETLAALRAARLKIGSKLTTQEIIDAVRNARLEPHHRIDRKS